MKKIPWIWILFIIALCIGLYFGSYRLTESPPTWYDEGMILQLAENLANHGTMALQLAPNVFVSAWHVSTGYPVVIPIAVVYKLFGVGILQARIVALLFLLGLIIAAFVFLRKLYGDQYALWGIFLVATFSSLYGNGKNVLGEVPGLFFLVLFLFFLKKLEDGYFANWKHALWASIFLGITCSTKPIFFLTIPALVIAALINRKKIIWNKSWIIALISGGIITGIIWVYMQFGPTDSISSVLHFYTNPYDANSLSRPIIANIKRFFTESTPIYTLLTFLIWTAAVIIRKFKKENISSVELSAYVFSILILIAYLRMPGWYRYLFPANIPILMFLPFAIKIIAEKITGAVNSRLNWKLAKKYGPYVPHLFIVLFLLFQSYYMFSGSWISTASSGTQSAVLVQYGSKIDSQKSYFIFDIPQVVPFLKTDNYYQYFSGNGVWVAGAEYLELLKKGQPDFVIIDNQNIEPNKGYLAKYSQSSMVGRYAILERNKLMK